MSLMHVHWSSQVLGQKVSMNVIVPDRLEPPFAVFYLLHGLSDDYSIWLRRTSIERYVEGLPLIVVMPDGHRGFYTDMHDGPSYGRYMAEEIPTFVERAFPAKRDRGGRCIGGLSMGGYGALRLALAHPERYASVTSHSGALMAGHNEKPREGGPITMQEARRIFGERPRGTRHDLVHLAKVAKESGAAMPAIRMDCGREDFLLEDNRRFHAELERLGVGHEYEEFAGAHTWAYWDQHVVEAIRFHVRALNLITT
jgi:S-formylglutathione hydrolase FrmB